MSAFSYALALTGSIASGKSTVASLLKLHGLQCIDADATAHKILDEEAQSIKALFGEEYLLERGVNRKKLGELIFNDREQKKRLESFMHPKIRQSIEKQAQRFEKLKFPYLIDIPLFFETKAYDIKYSVVVFTPKRVQLERLMKRNKLTQAQAQARIAAQMDIEKKRDLADFVIDNSHDLKHLQGECERFVESIKNLNLMDS